MILLRKTYARADYEGLSNLAKKNLKTDRDKLATKLREIRSQNNWAARNGGDMKLRNELHKTYLKSLKKNKKNLIKQIRKDDGAYQVRRIGKALRKLIKKAV